MPPARDDDSSATSPPAGGHAPAYDQALKRLLTDAHDGVLALLFPQGHWLGERSPELPAHRRQADLVWDVTDSQGEHILLHIELQTDADSEIGERVAEYAIRLWRAARLPVRSVVVALREGGAPMDSPFTIGRGEGKRGLQYDFEIVRLWEVDATRVLASPDPRLWALAPLMAGPVTELTRVAARQLGAADLPRGERTELAGLLTVLAGMRLSRALLEDVVRSDPMLSDIIRVSSLTEWMREEGEAKGREEALRTVAQDLLTTRFGAVATDEAAALQHADAATLRAAATHLLTDSRVQFRVWLGLPAAPAN